MFHQMYGQLAAMHAVAMRAAARLKNENGQTAVEYALVLVVVAVVLAFFFLGSLDGPLSGAVSKSGSAIDSAN